MKLAVSNIAWSGPFEEEAVQALRALGVEALELAPTRPWPDWVDASAENAAIVRKQYSARGLSIPSMQAILFGKPQCKLFGADSERDSLLKHLRFCADLAVGLGAQSLVFGAPKNRDLNGLTPEQAFDSARETFAAVAGYYHAKGVCLCLEANPPQYGCTFITNSREASRLVTAVDSPGFRLHLDTACMFLAGEDIPAAIDSSRDILQHFHASEPNLGDFGAPLVDHASAARALRSINYSNWISLEMREAQQPVAALRDAVRFVTGIYGFGS
ncbi:MAG TPA: sugar phosphate isomerase/epimerase family protein [Bryobacteraceae bacterium]|nr:sugar phosphate isomerase/epimerase family protein [Bryobacteraceae bacterium]